jgi:excisionase family DNA binding protein
MDSLGYLSPHQAAQRLDLSTERIRQLTREGKLPCVQTPLGRLIPEEAVEQLAQRRQRKEDAA